jgi:hypothetical protein
MPGFADCCRLNITKIKPNKQYSVSITQGSSGNSNNNIATTKAAEYRKLFKVADDDLLSLRCRITTQQNNIYDVANPFVFRHFSTK